MVVHTVESALTITKLVGNYDVEKKTFENQFCTEQVTSKLANYY